MLTYTRILPGSTWCMATFIMGYCNSRPSVEYFHGICRQKDWLLNSFPLDDLITPYVSQQVLVILGMFKMSCYYDMINVTLYYKCDPTTRWNQVEFWIMLIIFLCKLQFSAISAAAVQYIYMGKSLLSTFSGGGGDQNLHNIRGY